MNQGLLNVVSLIKCETTMAKLTVDTPLLPKWLTVCFFKVMEKL